MKSKKPIKSKFASIIKSNINLPSITNSPEKKLHKESINQNSNLTDRSSFHSNSLNDSFMQRNYLNYIEKEKLNFNRMNTNILSQTDLETILFNLKKNYNLITTVTQQRNHELNNLTNNLEKEEEKLNKLIDFKEIELPDEKISLRKLGDTNLTKEQLRNHLFELLNEKRSLDEQVNVANEYTKTVEHMIVVEKKRLRVMQEETNQMTEKLNNFNKYNKLIKENLQKTKLKNNNFSNLSEQLQKNIELANNIIDENNEKNKVLENKIIYKEESVENLRHTIDFMKQQNKENFIKYKEDHFEKISKSKENQEEKIRKERKYVDIIYCLYVLQKCFIEQDSYASNLLHTSKEYNAIINQNYEIATKPLNVDDRLKSLKSTGKIMEENNTNINDYYRQRTNSYYRSSKEIFRQFNKNKSIVPNFRSSCKISNRLHNTTLIQLIDILNQINISKDSIFDYISKLQSKISLYQFNLNNLHSKEILLNDKKHDYSERVKKIISDNFLNFEELVKNNSKFQTFLYKNENFINEMKLKNRENNLNEINKQLNSYNKNKDTIGTSLSNQMSKEEKEKFDKKEKKQLIKDQLIINANDSYKKANDLILKMNYFFDNILDILNNIANTIQNILKSPKNENEENSQNNLLEFLNSVEQEKEKILEFKKANILTIKTDASSFIDYLKKLIEYNKNELQDKMDNNDLENKLLNIFFNNNKDNKGKNKIGELAYNQFILSSNISNQYDIFYHFRTLSEQTVKIIKSVLSFIKNNQDLIQKYENKTVNSDRSSSKSIIAVQNNTIYSLITNAKAKLKNSTMNSKKIKLSNKQAINDKEKADDFDSVLVEDKDTSLETKSVRNEEKLFKSKFNNIEKKIMNHLYQPSLEKTTYLRKLNLEMKNIKSLTFSNSKYNFFMNQKKNEIDLMSKQMMVYNNPGLHPNELTNKMYNNINSIMIQGGRIKTNFGKRLKSTLAKRRPIYKI